MNKEKTFLLGAIAFLIACLLAGCGSFGNTPTTAPVADNQSGTIEEKTVSASGEVSPDRWVSLGFPNAGQNLGVYVKTGDIVGEGKLLAEVDHTDAKAALENAKAQLASAKAQLDRLDESESSDTTIEAAKAAVTAAEAGVNYAFENWMSTYLYAPYDGTIVAASGNNGGIVLPGQEIFILADLTTLQVVTTDMSEVDVVHVRIGNPVEVSFDALPDITTTGRVAKIASSKSIGSGVYYTITITLDSIPEELRWGMSAFVIISVDEIVSTSTPTLTSTVTPTITPTPTPPLGAILYKVIVMTVGEGGVNLRDEPNGDLIKVLVDGTKLEVYEEQKLDDGSIWLKVLTDDEVEGWIIKGASATLTPTPTPIAKPTDKTGGGGGDLPPDLPPDTTIPPDLTQPPTIP